VAAKKKVSKGQKKAKKLNTTKTLRKFLNPQPLPL
jgi:hypothetical protein